LDELGVLDERTLAVHLLQLRKGDLDILARRSCAICLCPRSNVNLHGRLPRVAEMLKAGLKPALGTDSLASCESLKIRDEMAYLAKRFPGIQPRDILDMATCNGARALGVDAHYGDLSVGKRSEFLYVNTGAKGPDSLLESIIHHV
ncbi:MAG: amidohydrolase family protein, partial [Desulfobacterales bacterium]|nr:amidohydrolase family protein [Desulfobacterales bacterium]